MERAARARTHRTSALRSIVCVRETRERVLRVTKPLNALHETKDTQEGPGRGGSPPAGMKIKASPSPPPPPLQGAQPMPSHCPPDAKCEPHWHL